MKRIMIWLVVMATALAFTTAAVTVGMAAGSDTKPPAKDETKKPPEAGSDTKPKPDKPKPPPPPPPDEGC
jgi:hypothetical protein